MSQIFFIGSCEFSIFRHIHIQMNHQQPTCSWYLPSKQWFRHGKKHRVGCLYGLFGSVVLAERRCRSYDRRLRYDFFFHMRCVKSVNCMCKPGIITLPEGDYINSILGRWGRGFFRCSDCYFNDRYSKQKCCVDLLKCNVKYATVTRGLAIWNDYINSRNKGKRLPVFHSHGFHTAIFMVEEQIWTPQLFIKGQPLWSADFFSLVPCLRLV